MGRPKGSGRGLVPITIRVEPEVYQALQEYSTRSELSLAEGARVALRAALLEQTPGDLADDGYNEGLRRGLAEARTKIQAALEKEWR